MIRRLLIVALAFTLQVADTPAFADGGSLPGAGVEIPVDVDGDGVSSFPDRWIFNQWLVLGGSLEEALLSAVLGSGGTIDLSAFFASDDAILPPTALAPTPAASPLGTPIMMGSSSSPQVLHPFGGGAALELFEGGSPNSDMFDFPTGYAFEDEGFVLWASTEAGTAGMHRLHMPPLLDPLRTIGNETFPRPLAGVEYCTTNGGVNAHALSPVRYDPPNDGVDGDPCVGVPGDRVPHVLNTWSTGFGVIEQICRSANISPLGGPCAQCENCVEVRGNVLVSPESTYTVPCDEPVLFRPLAIDVLQVDSEFGEAQDFVCSDRAVDDIVRIRRGSTSLTCDDRAFDPFWTGLVPTDPACDDIPTPGLTFNQSFLETLYSHVADVETELGSAVFLPVVAVHGVAVGDFGGRGVYGIYYIAELEDSSGDNPRQVRRLVWNSGIEDEFFVKLPDATGRTNNARGIEFDVYDLPSGLIGGSGELFVSEESFDDARIWRIDESGDCEDFGTGFSRPLGMAFHPLGAMFVSQDFDGDGNGNMLYIDLKRKRFNRGDSNGDGPIDIADAIALLDNLFPSGAPTILPCLDAADVNDDSVIDVADSIHLLSYLFQPGSPAPPPPSFPSGLGVGCTTTTDVFLYVDPTPDTLGCLEYLDCEEAVW